MKSLGFVIMLIVVGALAFASGANATSPPSWARVEKIHSNDPLRMAHLVMEATFVRVDVEQFSHERYCNLFMQESLSDDARKRNSLGVLYAELKDIRVIRGNRPVRRLATFPYPVTRLESGQRVIVCGYYIPAAGEYFAFGPECTLWKTDQGWKRESYNGPGNPSHLRQQGALPDVAHGRVQRHPASRFSFVEASRRMSA